MDVETANAQDAQQQSSTPWLSNWSVACATGQDLFRRIKLEFVVELPMLKQRWKIIVFGLIMQYVHGIFTQLAHRMHQPQETPLHDVGFSLTPELGPDKFWVSEAIFGTLFALFLLWTFTPFVTNRKRFYTAVMWSRLLMVLVVCQALRIVTFSATQLPGPSFHCRSGEETAIRPWPKHWSGHLIVDVSKQVTKSCGDLVFSSHTIFMLTGILTYNEYGSLVIMKLIAWVCGAIVSLLIIASRKHYTVDIVVAWYTVPLVFYSLHRRWTTKRPMSEFLGAMGELDEPDPIDAELDQVVVDRAAGDGKSELSHVKERSLAVKQQQLQNGSSNSSKDNSSSNSPDVHNNVDTSIVNVKSIMNMGGSMSIARARSSIMFAAEPAPYAEERPLVNERLASAVGAGISNGSAHSMMQRSPCRIS